MRAIDADKLMEKTRYIGLALGYTSTGGRRVRTITEDDIKSAPTITYADLVPHGEWRFVCQIFCDGGYDDIYVCSECYEELDIGIGKGLPNYCPNCGAKMDK